MKFTEMLSERWQNAGSMLCVGLDPNPTRFPHELAGRSTALYDFCCGIIDATADLVCAFKPQIAYFASCGAEAELKAVIDYIHANHPKVPVILDAKRGDIGSTAEHYAREAFERYEADCVTLSPFMGFDTIKPYLAYENKGAFILCRTSNPGAKDFEYKKLDDGRHVYDLVGDSLTAIGKDYMGEHGYSSIGLVIGGTHTYPAELANVRRIAPNLPLLVPGIGAQGGDIRACVEAGKTAEGTGMVINSGRAIIYASREDDWKEAARKTAIATRDSIQAAV